MRRYLVVSLIAFSLFLATSQMLVFAPDGVYDVEVPLLSNPITLDGAITGDEWSDAVEMSVTFRFYNATTMELVDNRTGSIYLKNDCVDLWTCIQVEDTIEDLTEWDMYPSGVPGVMGDTVWVFYDVVEGGGIGGAGDDEKGVLHPDFTYDGAITPGPSYDQDTNLGGTKDVDGASGWAGGWLTIEYVHPLNSGDSTGNDPSLNPGDEITGQFIAMDPELFDSDYGVAMKDTAYLFNLKLALCPSVGGSSTVIHPVSSSYNIPLIAAIVFLLLSSVVIVSARKT
jgi:hypothetical protein